MIFHLPNFELKHSRLLISILFDRGGLLTATFKDARHFYTIRTN